MKAMVVESRPALRHRLGVLLGGLGFEVRLAKDGKEARSLSAADSAYALWVIGLDPSQRDSLELLAGALLGGLAPKRVIALRPAPGPADPAQNFDDEGFIRKVHQLCPESRC